jgi:hypothetical protein
MLIRIQKEEVPIAGKQSGFPIFLISSLPFILSIQDVQTSMNGSLYDTSSTITFPCSIDTSHLWRENKTVLA